MLHSMADRWISWNRVTGLDIFILPDGSWETSVSTLEKKKGTIVAERQLSGSEAYEEFKKDADRNIPVVLSLHGKGVLVKKLSSAQPVDQAKIVQTVLPNAQPGDFYVQQTPSPQGDWVSLVRRSQADEILAKLYADGFGVIRIALGPFALEPLSDWMDTDQPVQAGRYTLGVVRGAIATVSSGEQVPGAISRLGDESIGGQFLLSYAAAFNFLLKMESSRLEVPAVDQHREEQLYKKLFRIAGWAALLFFLLLLMINFATFTYLHTRKQELDSRNHGYRERMNNHEKVKRQLSEKERFLDETGWMEASHLSYYADRLAAGVPSSIRLTAMELNPLDKKQSERNKTVQFDTDRILISGTSQSSGDLNNWIKEMKKQSWAKTVNITDYTFNEREKAGEFKLSIDLK